VQTWSFMLRIKFSAGRQFSASKPARTQSPKTLWASLNDSVTDTDRQENHRQFGVTVLND